jgi:hypothetical protein
MQAGRQADRQIDIQTGQTDRKSHRDRQIDRQTADMLASRQAHAVKECSRTIFFPVCVPDGQGKPMDSSLNYLSSHEIEDN